MYMRSGGFSLLEILIVILIMGLMAVLIVPQFGKTQKSQEQLFVAQFNQLMQTAWQQAVISAHVHKIFVDFKERIIRIEEQQAGAVGDKKVPFVPVRGIAADTSMSIPSSFIFVNFFIDGRDEMRESKRKDVWFFIMPDGTTQSVIINIKNLPSDEQPQESVPTFGMVLNPFNAQFDYYDNAQKP